MPMTPGCRGWSAASTRPRRSFWLLGLGQGFLQNGSLLAALGVQAVRLRPGDWRCPCPGPAAWSTPPAGRPGPAAFMRGARPKPILPGPQLGHAVVAAVDLERGDAGRLASFMSSSPFFTRMRLGPVRLTTSATVPRATRSRNWRMSRASRSRRFSAAMSMKATPTPASSHTRPVQASPQFPPHRRGLQIAAAGGSSAGGRWWSLPPRSCPARWRAPPRPRRLCRSPR